MKHAAYTWVLTLGILILCAVLSAGAWAGDPNPNNDAIFVHVYNGTGYTLDGFIWVDGVKQGGLGEECAEIFSLPPGLTHRCTVWVPEAYEHNVCVEHSCLAGWDWSCVPHVQSGEHAYVNCQCYPTCFLGGTLITMADNSLKAIDDIAVGEQVRSYDETTGKITSAKVTKVFAYKTDYYIVINGDLRVTASHKLYAGGKWVPAGHLAAGDKLFSITGETVPIQSLEQVFVEASTYNLEVNGTHTFFAGGILAHNKPEPSEEQ